MFETLLSPLAVGPRVLRNRVIQLATANRLEADGHISDASVAFYEARARGGVGAIVTGALSVHASGDHAFLPAHDPRARDDFARVAAAVRPHGALIIGQVNHVGRQHHQNGIPGLVSASAVACRGSGGTPRELDVGEIDEFVDAFVRSAVNLRAAGFDGVEVHGGQGYLIQQFLSPLTNRRTDDYGGSLSNRCRFATRILTGIREACGADFVVGLRLGVAEFVEGGLTIEQSQETAALLTERVPVDYLSVTQANFESISHHTPDRRFERAPYARFARAIGEVVGDTPVVTCGRILEPDTAEELLTSGTAQLIGLCRPLIADPDWVAKAAAGRPGSIRRCVSCNQCWGWIATARRIGCSVNPRTGHEAEVLTPAGGARRVVVVGAGPAGLQAALSAARGGDDVWVVERAAAPGGAVREAAVVPGYEELGWLVEDLYADARDSGVRFEFGREATVEWVRERAPDAVYLATGARPRLDDLPKLADVAVGGYADALSWRPDGATGTVVVVDDDGYYAGTAVAEELARKAGPVVLVTPYFEVGREIPATARITTLAALDRLGVEIVTGAWPAGADAAGLRLRRLWSGREWTVPGVTHLFRVGNPLPRLDLFHRLAEAGYEPVRVGDAFQPRRLFESLREGERVGVTGRR